MGAINNTLVNAGKYYDLSGLGGNKTGQGQAAANAALGVAPTAVITKTGGGKGGSYLLDLSADAQRYLTNYTREASPAKAEEDPTHGGGFQLSKKQQSTLAAIIAKYKDAPYTQETFQKIQDDIGRAGLSPQKLALLNNARKFNATSLFLQALNGKLPDAGATQETVADKEKANAEQYIQSIAAQWKKVSTTAQTSPDSPFRNKG